MCLLTSLHVVVGFLFISPYTLFVTNIGKSDMHTNCFMLFFYCVISCLISFCTHRHVTFHDIVCTHSCMSEGVFL